MATDSLSVSLQLVTNSLTSHRQVHSLAFATTPDGQLILASGTEGSLRIWNLTTGDKLRAPLDENTGTVYTVAFATTPDGQLILASGSGDNTIRLWNPLTARVIRRLYGHTDWISTVAFATIPDGQLILASGSGDNTIRLWNLSNGQQLHKLDGHTDQVRSLAFTTTPDGPRLASSGDDGTIRIWNPDTGEQHHQLDGHTGPIRSLASATLNGHPILASGGHDAKIRLWNLSTQEITRTLSGHTNTINSLAFAATPDDELILISGDADGTIKLWDPETGDSHGTPSDSHGDPVQSLSLITAPNNKLILAYSNTSGIIRLRSLAAGQPYDVLLNEHPSVRSLTSFTTDDDELILASGHDDGIVKCWNSTTGYEYGVPFDKNISAVRSLASFTTPTGERVLASGYEDGTIYFHDLTAGLDHVIRLDGHTGPVTSLDFAMLPDEGLILASGSDDLTVRVWHPLTKKLLYTLPNHVDTVHSIAFTITPTRELILASVDGDGTIRHWDPATGKQLNELPTHSGPVTSSALASTPNRRLFLASFYGSDLPRWNIDGTIQIWDSINGQQLNEFPGHEDGSVAHMSFVTNSNNQLLLASAGDDLNIRIWEPLAGKILSTYASVSPVTSIVFAANSDGQLFLAIGDDDGNIILWRVYSPEDSPPDPAPPLSTHALPSRDDELTEDLLGREILAGHLEGVLNQLVASQGGDDRTQGTVVVNIDGRWGSGKSVLAKLTADRLAEIDDGKSRKPGEEATEEQASGDRKTKTQLHLADPIVVWFNAWQQSTVGPRWWTLISQVKHHVEKERSLPSRLLLRSVETGARLFRSKAQLFTGLAILAITIFLLWTSFPADPGTATAPALSFWDKVIEMIGKWDQVGKIVGGIAAFAVILLALGRVLFWTSPAIGKLYLNAESKPLAEVSEILARLRRWTPRQGQLVADWLLTAWLLFCWYPVITGLIASRASSHGSYSSRFSTSLLSLGNWTPTVAIGLTIFGSVVYYFWLWSGIDTPRRPIVLVIDDLDRCSAEDTAEYLETVHTLMRADKTLKRFTRWRTPAPFVVLVLADGRWVRTAFERQYQDFVELGDESRRLGADFIQKLFDHTVLVPELNLDQVWDFVNHVTQSAGPRLTARPAKTTDATIGDSARQDVVVATNEGPGQIGENGEGTNELPAMTETGETPLMPDKEGDGDLHQKPSNSDPGANEPSEDTRVLPFSPSQPDPLEAARVVKQAADEAEAAASIEAVVEDTRHLITTYHQILPANPRLIRRVVNTWGMLTALRKHVRHSEEDDTLIRAAVFFVMFPTLTDELLSSKPLIGVKDILAKKYDGPWKHPDVLRVLQTTDDEIDEANLKPEDFLEPRVLARCYGRQC